MDGAEPLDLDVMDLALTGETPQDVRRLINDMRNQQGRLRSIVAVSTRLEDQRIVDLYAADNDAVVPGFGFHPWFVHWIYDDRQNGKEPDARQHFDDVLGRDVEEILQGLLAQLEKRKRKTGQGLLPLSQWLAFQEAMLRKHPNAIVGEVGLDKSFRLPFPKGHGSNMPLAGISGNGHPPRLSKTQTKMSHQTTILREQLDLAIKLNRSVSMHCVQCHGTMLEVLKAFPLYQRPPRICMHSFSGSVNSLEGFIKQINHIDVYFSFSILVNAKEEDLEILRGQKSELEVKAPLRPRRKGRGTLTELIKTVPDDRLLIESDYHDLDGLDQHVEDMLVLYSIAKGWSIEETTDVLQRNWEAFAGGN